MILGYLLDPALSAATPPPPPQLHRYVIDGINRIQGRIQGYGKGGRSCAERDRWIVFKNNDKKILFQKSYYVVRTGTFQENGYGHM